MKYASTALLSLAVALFVLVPTGQANAQTTYYTNAQLQAQIQLLMQQVSLLQQQLPLASNSYHYDTCATSRYCDDHRIDEIEVDFVGRVAQVRVVYDRGSDDRFALYANTTYEVAVALSRELNLPVVTIERLIDVVNGFDDDRGYDEDIRSIDVTFKNDDADVLVRFRDGDTDRFTIRNVDEDEDEVIEEIADRYDMRERDIEDLTDFEYEHGFDEDNLRYIDVDFYRNDAHIEVGFWNGKVDRLTLRNIHDDEDEVIEYLARRYDMDEDEVEDFIHFN